MAGRDRSLATDMNPLTGMRTTPHRHFQFLILNCLPHHAHPSFEVDLHEVRAGGIWGEVKRRYGLHRGGIGGLPCLHQVGEFAALEVIEFYALVTVHIAVHVSRAARGVGRNVYVALAPVKVILDAHRVVGDEGLGRYVVKVRRQTNRKGIPMVIRREYWTMHNLSGF